MIKLKDNYFKKYIKSIFLLLSILSLLIFIIDIGYAQRRGITLEANINSTPQTTGRPFMTDAEFLNLMRRADDLLRNGRFRDAINLLEPYEVYIFGNTKHWNNMAHYNYRMAQASSYAGRIADTVFYLKAILDNNKQPTPTNHFPQYVTHDENGNSLNGFYFGAAKYNTDTTIKNLAQQRWDALFSSNNRSNAQTDPRMLKEFYPGARARRSR